MNKQALITGASRGIGRAIAYELAMNGYDLYLVSHKSTEVLKELEKELETTYHINVKVFTADVGNYSAMEKCFEKIKPLDVLVNNAGVSYIGLFTDMVVEDWHRVIDTNLSSVFYISKLAIPDMIKRHSGKIINVSSVWGTMGASMEVAYSASKGGLNALTKSLAKELAPSHIQVNAIACGLIDTDMNECFSEEDLNLLKEEIPMDRIGKPEEVAKLVLQLVNGPEYLTGQIISLDGGWY